MSVFLRWGVFGILAFAGLLYAYNASKHLADQRTAKAAAAAETGSAAANAPLPELTAEERAAIGERCLRELAVARRAIEARDGGEPFDRVLRMQEIVFLEEDAKLRARLTKVATRWFEEQGAIDALTLRRSAVTECQEATL
jgi:hypothetical protein